MSDYAILFVCTGNICRSPTAHGVLRQLLQEHGLAGRVRVDSAGTHGYHAGSPPDERSQEHAARRGYDLSDLRARPLATADFGRHDLILAMDHGHVEILRERCPPSRLHVIRRFTEFCRQSSAQVVPDPYYGGAQGFEQVLDLVEDACAGLLQHVQEQLD